MPRRPRKISASGIYHVVIRGADHQLLFTERKDYQRYINTLKRFKEECEFSIYAYCLMNNHVHLLIQEGPMSISDIFRKINTSYATWFNMKYLRTGYVQQGRFFSEPITDREQLLYTLCYIHYNPCKAGLETNIGDSYFWSSFREYKKAKSWIDRDFIMNNLCDIDNFYELHQKYEYIKGKAMDIDTLRKRLPDDVAQEIIYESCGCKTPFEFQKMELPKKKELLRYLHEQNLSIRQLNRLTGIPKGYIEKVLSQEPT